MKYLTFIVTLVGLKLMMDLVIETHTAKPGGWKRRHTIAVLVKEALILIVVGFCMWATLSRR